MKYPAMPIVNRFTRAALVSIFALSAALNVSGADCPAGTGNPLTFSYLKSRETVGHEYMLVKGTADIATRAVTLTRQAPGYPDEKIDWPADSGVFKGVARLRPGENRLVVTAAGQAPVCVDVAYNRNPMPQRPMKATIVLAADQGEGPGLLLGPQVQDATDLEGIKKRASFALSMTQTVLAEMMRRTTGTYWAPGVKLDPQGRPEVNVFRSRWTTQQLENMPGNGAGAVDSVRREMGTLLSGKDLHAVFILFFVGGYDWPAGTGPWFSRRDHMHAWPQDFGELPKRLSDTGPSGYNGGVGNISMATNIGEYYGTFGFFVRTMAQSIRYYPEENKSPFAQAWKSLQFFMLRDIDLQRGPRLLASEEVGINGGRDGADPFLATEAFEKPLPSLASRPAPGAVPGLAVQYHEGDYQALPDFKAKPLSETSVPQVTLPATARPEQFALRYTGWINVAKAGAYRFHLTSDDGSKLYLDDTLLVDNDGAHVAQTRYGAAWLEAGYHAFRLDYFNRVGGGSLDLKWESPESAPAAIPGSVLFRTAATGLRGPEAIRAPSLRSAGGYLVVRSGRAQRAHVRLLSPSGRRSAILFSGRLPAGETRVPSAARGSIVILDAEDGRSVLALP